MESKGVTLNFPLSLYVRNHTTAFRGMFTLGLIQKANATLVQLVSIGKRILPSLRISAQGLHKRINNKAVEFLVRMFAGRERLHYRVLNRFLYQWK